MMIIKICAAIGIATIFIYVLMLTRTIKLERETNKELRRANEKLRDSVFQPHEILPELNKRTFITDKAKQAIKSISLTEEERISASNEIYEKLKVNIDLAKYNAGRDYIIQVPERKVGKSYNLMKLANETGFTIIAPNKFMADYIKREAFNKHGWYIKTVNYKSIPTYQIDTKDLKNDVMLKDEGVDIADVRDMLYERGICWVSVVGVN